MKKLVSATILIITSLLLSSCSNFIRTAIPINISNPGYESYRVAIAVDFLGVKHIARSECPIGTTTNCKLIYSRAYSGGAVDYWTWEPDTEYSGVYELEIATADDGNAIIAWNTYKTSSGALTTLFMVADPPLTVQELMPGYAASGKPLLVSRFNVIYAVSSVADGSNYALRYRQVYGGSASGWVSEHGIAFTSSLANAAVSPSGSLYVAYRRYPGADIWYADNYGITGDITNRFLILASATNYVDLEIDVYGSPETVYLAYYINQPTNDDALAIGLCPADSCIDVSDIDFIFPLDSSKHWAITSAGGIIADSDISAYYVFNAVNDDTAGDIEIFEVFIQGGLTQSTLNISNLPGHDYFPAIGLTVSFIPVISWVHEKTIYEFETLPIFGYSYKRNIYTTSNNIMTSFPGTDMSCNADWCAGIWNENEAANRAFITFNTYPAMLPSVIR